MGLLTFADEYTRANLSAVYTAMDAFIYGGYLFRRLAQMAAV